jgi:hypothetical protein
MTEQAQWVAGSFTVPVMEGVQVGEQQIAGWLWGNFALDFRIWDDDMGEPYCPGWLLSHVPTGLALFGIEGSLAHAQEMAEGIARLGDWSFTTVDQIAPELSKTMGAYKRETPGLLLGNAYFSPIERLAHPKEHP